MGNKVVIQDDIKTVDVNEVFGITEAQRTDYSVAWNITAKSNLQSAKILYHNQRYSHTVFFLQQSIECVVKGILAENSITDDIKSLGHNPEKAFELFYARIEASIANISAINNRIGHMYDFKSRMHESANILNETYTTVKELKENISNDEIDIAADAYKYLGLNSNTSKSEAQIRLLDIQFVQILVYLFSKLFNPCQQETRYPGYKNDRLVVPEMVYSSQDVADELDTIIKWFDYILDMIL